MAKLRIVHQGNEQHFAVRTGLGFQAVCVQHQTPLEFDCRAADCGICIFRVLEGGEHLTPPTPQEKDFLKAMRADSNERLACQARIMGDVSVLVDEY